MRLKNLGIAIMAIISSSLLMGCAHEKMSREIAERTSKWAEENNNFTPEELEEARQNAIEAMTPQQLERLENGDGSTEKGR